MNLAIKAVMGIEAYSILTEIAGKPEETEKLLWQAYPSWLCVDAKILIV